MALASNRARNTLAAHYPGGLLYHVRAPQIDSHVSENRVCGKPLGFKQRGAFPSYARTCRLRPVIITLYALRSVKNGCSENGELGRGGFLHGRKRAADGHMRFRERERPTFTPDAQTS